MSIPMKGVKLREFEWFEMETRVRQMVQELITPFTKRVFESLNGINQLKVLTSEEAIKLDELKKIVTNDPEGKEIDIFKQIDHKQEKLENEVLGLGNMMAETEKIVERRIKIQDQRLEESKEIVLNNMKLKERVSEQIFEQNESIKQFRTELEAIVGEIRLVLDKTIRDQEDDNKAHRNVEQKLADRIQALEEHSRLTDEKFEKNNKEHLLIHSKLIHLEEQSYKSNKEIKNLQDNLVYIKRLGNYIRQLEEKIHKQEFAVQHLSPLITQAQLSETLYAILPVEQKRKLIIYQYDKFSQLNNHILETDNKKSTALFNGTEMLESVQKRNTKEVINMKRKKLISMGIDIDNVNYDAKEKFYKEVVLTEDEIGEEGEIRVNSGPDQNEIANTINKMIELAFAEFNAKLSHQMLDSKKYFQQIEQQLQITLEKSTRVVDRYSEGLERFKVEQSLINKQFEREIQVLDEYRQSSGRNMQSMSNSLMTVMQFCTLINHLQIQDELDKQSISLFGLKQEFSADILGEADIKKRPVVNLEKSCFSCNGFPASTMSAFKMACLAYTPSTIKLDSREYKREQLLQISTKILHHLKQELSPPSSSPKIKPQSDSIPLDITIKKKAHTQPNFQQKVISPPKLTALSKVGKLSTTMTSQIRTKTRSKILKTEEARDSTKKYNAAMFTTVFNEAKKRHSMHFQKKLERSYQL